MELKAQLVHAESGRRVVEVQAFDGSRLLGSALGEAADAEQAEDRARQRLLTYLAQSIAPETAGPDTTVTETAGSQVAGSEAAISGASAVIRRSGGVPLGAMDRGAMSPAVLPAALPLRPQSLQESLLPPPLSRGLNQPDLARRERPAGAIQAGVTDRPADSAQRLQPDPPEAVAPPDMAAPSGGGNRSAGSERAHETELPAGSDYPFDSPAGSPRVRAALPTSVVLSRQLAEPASHPPALPQEPPPDPEDWSSDLAALELHLRRLGWDREQEGIYLQRAFGHPSRNRLTNYSDLQAYLVVLARLGAGSEAATAAVPLRRSELLNQCETLLAQLGWNADQGRAFLERELQVASRQQLNDQQLLHFNMLLESEMLAALPSQAAVVP